VKIDREQWVRLSALLDDALDIDAAEREAWLRGLSGEAATLKEPLRLLLAQHAHIETDEFLKAPDFASALRAESARRQTGPSELQPGSTVGGYRLLRELGRGGMGSVWLATRIDGRLQRQVALKFPYAGPRQRQLAERLGRERDILARLEHPNIARLYDADVTALGQPFLVLEFVDGMPIDEYCDQHRLTIRERLVLFLQVLGALQYAHSHLVIHRDLKPSNILITGDRVARLLDFGIAKLISDGEAKETALTRFGGQALTPDYASPEQITGRLITTASDVYSLGVVLYELLTGTRPYRLRRDSRASLEEAIAEADVIAPSRASSSAGVAEKRSVSVRKLTHELRGDMDAIIHKALQKNPEERYASVDALTQDIKHWLDGEVVVARPPGTWYGLSKLVRRNRVLFGAVAAVFVSLTAGAAVAIWQARSAIAQTQRLQATKGFLIDVFNANSREQPDPMKAQQATARELLDRAAERLTALSQASPDVAEEMLSILGGLYQDLGLDAKSAELLLRRAEILKQLYGADDARTAQGQIDYAKSLYATNEWKKALAPLEDAERILDRHRDDSSATRALLLSNMAEYFRGVDRGRARVYAARAIALDRKKYPRSSQFIEDLRVAALIDSETSNRSAAIAFLEEALAVQESSGAAEIYLIKPLVELAELQAYLPDPTPAEKNFKRGLEISRRLNGDAHIDTIQASLRYGEFLHYCDRLAESETLLKEAEANAVKLLGEEESFHVPTVRAKLAETEHALGNFAVAADLFRRALATREKTRSGNRGHASILLRYAALLTDMGRADESLGLLSRAIEYYGKSDVPVGSSEIPVILSATLSALGRPGEAVDALDRFKDHELLSPVMVIELEMRRAGVFDEQGELEKAESSLRTQLQRINELPQPDQKRLLRAQGQIQLGRVLIKRHLANEACGMLETAMQRRMADLSPRSPLLADSEVALAECLSMLGQTTQSRSLLSQAQAIDAMNPELGPQYRTPLNELTLQLASAGRSPPARGNAHSARGGAQRMK
jgi:serine/threonine-protein kinase